MADDQEILNRWRLVLGKYAADQIPFAAGDLKMMEMEEEGEEEGGGDDDDGSPQGCQIECVSQDLLMA